MSRSWNVTSTAVFVSLAAGWACGTLYAADPLASVPAGVAGVIGFRNIDDSVAKANALARRIDESYGNWEASAFVKRLGLQPGVCDPTQPVYLILGRPTFDESTLIIAFAPAKDVSLELKDGEVTSLECDSESSVLLKDGFAFMSRRKRGLYAIRRTARAASLAAALDGRQTELRSQSDAFLHFRVPLWQPRIKPFIQLGAAMARVGVQSQATKGRDTKAEEAMVNWVIEGATKVLDQMEGLTVSAAFEADGLRLRHYHRFAPGGSVAKYLSSVSRKGVDPWAHLPAGPFLVAVSADWHVPCGQSLIAGMMGQMFQLPLETETVDPETCARLTKESVACYGQMHGMNMLVTSPPDSLSPMQIMGTYVFEDAARGLAQIQTIQEHAMEAISAFAPSGITGKSTPREIDGVRLTEMRLDSEKMDQETRKGIEAIYGAGCYVRQSIASRSRVAYAISREPDDLVRMVRRTGPEGTLASDASVRAITGSMPSDANVLMLFDVGRALAMVPHMIEVSMAMSEESTTTKSKDDRPPPSPGPLVGWAARVWPTAVGGEMFARTDDAVRIVELARDTSRQMRKTAQTHKSDR
jgi:hypothetical protein